MSKNVFDTAIEDIKTIHLKPNEKLDQLKASIGINNIDLKKYIIIERITNYLMREAEKSDENFLTWVYLIGSHIKIRFSGIWILIHYKSIDVDRYVPAVINEEQELWQVGNFCYMNYFNKNRMKGISFSTFYKLEIDRAIWKPKLKDINIPMNNIIFLEK